jgi:hypothetical protein
VQKSKLLAWGNALALALVLLVNGLAERLPINGRTTGEISAMYPTRITPASYAFMIWGLIYGLLILFVIYQLLPAGRSKPEVRDIGGWFIVSCAMNIAWLLLWHYLYIDATVFIMFALLISLFAVYTRTRSARPPIRDAAFWLVSVPFSIYLGWITVASIVNVSVVLINHQWNRWGLSEVAWTGIILLAFILLAWWIGHKFEDPFYLLTIVWTLIAIGVNQQSSPVLTTISWLAGIFLGCFALKLSIRALRWQTVL